METPIQRFSSKTRKLLLVTYNSQNSKLKKISLLIIYLIFEGFDFELSIFKNKRTSHPEILVFGYFAGRRGAECSLLGAGCGAWFASNV